MGKSWKEQGWCIVSIPNHAESFKVNVVGSFSSSMEGQDADGNRGRVETFLDDVDICEIEDPPEDVDELQLVEDKVYALEGHQFEWEGKNEGEY